MTSESFSHPHETDVLGSFVDGKKAKRAMIDKIIRRAQDDERFAYAMWKDENHSDFPGVMLVGKSCDASYPYVESLFDRDMDSVTFPDEVKVAMFNYLNAEIANDCGAYIVYASKGCDVDDTYRFEIQENELK